MYHGRLIVLVVWGVLLLMMVTCTIISYSLPKDRGAGRSYVNDPVKSVLNLSLLVGIVFLGGMGALGIVTMVKSFFIAYCAAIFAIAVMFFIYLLRTQFRYIQTTDRELILGGALGIKRRIAYERIASFEYDAPHDSAGFRGTSREQGELRIGAPSTSGESAPELKLYDSNHKLLGSYSPQMYASTLFVSYLIFFSETGRWPQENNAEDAQEIERIQHSQPLEKLAALQAPVPNLG